MGALGKMEGMLNRADTEEQAGRRKGSRPRLGKPAPGAVLRFPGQEGHKVAAVGGNEV